MILYPSRSQIAPFYFVGSAICDRGIIAGVTAVKRGQLAHLRANSSIVREGLPRWAGGHQHGGGTLKANNSA